MARQSGTGCVGSSGIVERESGIMKKLLCTIFTVILLLWVSSNTHAAPTKEISHSIAKFRKSASYIRLATIGIAAGQYAQDHSNLLPSTRSFADFKKAVTPYLRDAGYLYVPGTKTHYSLNPKSSGMKMQTPYTHEDWTILAYEPLENSEGYRLLLSTEGHVKRVSKEEWLVLKRKSGVP